MHTMTTPEGRVAFVVDQWSIDVRSTLHDGKTLYHMRIADAAGPVDLVIGNIDPISAATISKALQGGVVVVA